MKLLKLIAGIIFDVLWRALVIGIVIVAIVCATVFIASPSWL